MRTRRKTIALLAAGLIFTAIFGRLWLGGRYVMPAGYSRAADVWREMGLAPAEERVADGSRENPYDVVVWGSDPEGIAAALAAARNGLHTLLVDRRERVGGLFTLGQLNKIDMNYGVRKGFGRQPLTRGIFEEFQKKVGGTVFDIEPAQQVLEEMLAAEPLLTVLLDMELTAPRVEGEAVTALTVSGPAGERDIYGRVFIDASQDADLAFAAGAPFSEGFEDIGMPGKYQVSTLMFALDGVNWPRVMWETIVKDRRRSSAATLRAAWGYDQYVKAYVPENPQVAFRGFNMVRGNGGRVYINGLWIYGVNPYDRASHETAKEAAKQEAYRFAGFVRENLPGFAKAEIAGFADELYIRESRHLQALYRLSIDDVLENRDHWDRIGYGSYPVDIQAVDKSQPGYVVGEPEMYAIPFRSLVPPNFTNLLVVGRSAGYDSLAHGSARVVPVGMVGGQAAGVAAAYAVATGAGFREIAAAPEAISVIQDVLRSQGAYVEPSTAQAPAVVEDPDYPALHALRRLGLVAGGYGNDYALDEPLSTQAYLNLLYHGLARSLRLTGQNAAAERLYFVTAPQGGIVTGGNAALLTEEFLKYNPHVRDVVEQADAATFLLRVSESGEAGVPRRVLYAFVRELLETVVSESAPDIQ